MDAPGKFEDDSGFESCERFVGGEDVARILPGITRRELEPMDVECEARRGNGVDQSEGGASASRRCDAARARLEPCDSDARKRRARKPEHDAPAEFRTHL